MKDSILQELQTILIIGNVVPGGKADEDGRLAPNDKIYFNKWYQHGPRIARICCTSVEKCWEKCEDSSSEAVIWKWRGKHKAVSYSFILSSMSYISA